MQPNILQAIERLFFIVLHKKSFDRLVIPIIICMMRLNIEILLEIECLCITAMNNDLAECVMDFIAVGVISKLGD